MKVLLLQCANQTGVGAPSLSCQQGARPPPPDIQAYGLSLAIELSPPSPVVRHDVPDLPDLPDHPGLMSVVMGSPFLIILVGVSALLAFANAFIIAPSQLQRSPAVSSLTRIRTRGVNAACCRYKSSRIFQSERGDGEDTGPKNESTEKNEFSRTIRVSKWFRGGGGSSNRRSTKKMDLSISATPSELLALATRFRLTNITALSADMVVQPALGGGSDAPGSGGGESTDYIEARGTICAEVTQTCVRTNEEFDVNLEFSFETVLRAMASVRSRGNNAGNDDELSAGEIAALEAASNSLGNARKSRKKKGSNKQRVKGVSGDMGMNQLQNIFMEYEVTDEIIEDESCFCTDGIVDCGEIVAQMFRSKLDPYPKKPGSVSYMCALICNASVDTEGMYLSLQTADKLIHSLDHQDPVSYSFTF